MIDTEPETGSGCKSSERGSQSLSPCWPGVANSSHTKATSTTEPRPSALLPPLPDAWPSLSAPGAAEDYTTPQPTVHAAGGPRGPTHAPRAEKGEAARGETHFPPAHHPQAGSGSPTARSHTGSYVTALLRRFKESTRCVLQGLRCGVRENCHTRGLSTG